MVNQPALPHAVERLTLTLFSVTYDMVGYFRFGFAGW